MTKGLHISPDLNLPLDAVTGTLIIYGGKGMGKTNLGGVLVEEFYKARLRFSVIDPMGVWWGLQHGKDRESPGLEVLILGGVHGDLPIEPTAGAVVADLVVDETVSVVIDISRRPNGTMWSKADKIRFVTDYLTRLYERQGEQRRPLMQIIDEAARYAPQQLRTGEVDAAKCLGILETICEEGRNIGIGLCLLTQRSARLSKSVAELADCMIAFRTVGPNSIDAIIDWFGEHVPRDQHKSLVEQLRKLPIGSALVVSPGWLEFEGTAQMRLRETFDSSATPSVGHQLRAPGKARKPDLAKYQVRMAATIERVKADDPKELKKTMAAQEKEIEALKKRLESRPSGKDDADSRRAIKQLGQREAALKAALEEAIKFIIEITTRNFDASLPKDEIEAAINAAVTQGLKLVESKMDERAATLAKLQESAARLAKKLKALVETDVAVQVDVKHNEPHTVSIPPRTSAPVKPPVSRSAQVSESDNGDLGRMGIKMLTALVQHPKGLTKKQILIFTGYRSSGPTSKMFTTLLREGLVESPQANMLVITSAGVSRLGDFEPLPKGYHLREHLLREAGPMERRFLEVLFEVHPDSIGKGELLEKTGYKSSGPTSAMFTKLCAINYAEKAGPNRLRAADELFQE